MGYFHWLADPGTVSFSVKAFVSLFVIVDAIGNVPVFLSLDFIDGRLQ